jgi:hypothetical protein
MALARVQSASTYSSASGGVTYYFDITVSQAGDVSVRNIRGPLGLIADPVTEIPQSVLDDIISAKAVVIQTQTETQVLSGSIIFTGELYHDVIIAAGVLNNINYRVVYSTTDGVVLFTENVTTTGFRASVSTAYGSVLVPMTVGYVVLVATQQASTTSGTVDITDADSSQMAVTFTTAMATADYRVVLSPDGLYPVWADTRTRSGFVIHIGYTIITAEHRYVGYDVFV